MIQLPILASKKKKNISTIIVASCTMTSRILGLIRIALMSMLFGSTLYSDILNLVLSVPNNLRKLLAEGALSSVFMPIFAKTLSSNTHIKKGKMIPELKTQRFFSDLIIWVAIPILLSLIVASIFSWHIVGFLFHFDSIDARKIASQLFSIIIFFLFLMTLCSIAIGILHTHKRFVIAALSPLIISITLIISMLAFFDTLNIFSVVWGFIFGAVLQTLILYGTLFKIGYWFSFSLTLSKQMKNTFKRMIPTSLAVIIPIIGQQVAFYFASTLQKGSTTAFSYAIVFWQLPIGVVFNSIITVTFSYVINSLGNKDISRGKKDAQQYAQDGIFQMFIFAIPLSIGMYFFAHAGIAVALQRGKFDVNAVIVSSRILQGYALSLAPFVLYQLLYKLLYALQKNTIALLYSFLLTCIDIILSFFLIQTSLKIAGLSIAYALSLIIILPIMYRHVHSHIPISVSIFKIIKVILAMIPFYFLSFFLFVLTKEKWYGGSTPTNIFILFLIASILFLVGYISYMLFGILKLPSIPLKKKHNEKNI